MLLEALEETRNTTHHHQDGSSCVRLQGQAIPRGDRRRGESPSLGLFARLTLTNSPRTQ